ncbi:uncharacterized protein LOC128618676 isoform X1 [Ictalurus furcatus]|uniref:uncharacterized protein LOC128618676 isoform X1 n=1 Tax=Ictalurus furcatus TaxID=66913 RepID=UPI002350E880|nr:uncharacterized protein LOC128618676 isoform X1 [Ictalurus furcatus]
METTLALVILSVVLWHLHISAALHWRRVLYPSAFRTKRGTPALLNPSIQRSVEDANLLYEHDNMHKVRSMKTWCVKVGVEELFRSLISTQLNTFGMNWNWIFLDIPTSAPEFNLIDVAEWIQIPTETLQNLVESLPRRVERFIMGNRGNKSGMRCSTSVYGCYGQVTTNIWTYSVH